MLIAPRWSAGSKPPTGAVLKYSSLTTGLVGAWLGTEGAGLRALDAGPNQFHGTLVNDIRWGGGVSQFLGPVWNIPNTTGRVDLPLLGLGGNPGGFTVFARCRINAINPRVFAFGNAAGSQMFILGSSADGNVSQFWFANDQSASVPNYYGKRVTLAATWDSPRNVRALYWQGKQVASAAPGGAPNWTNAAYGIGNSSGSPGGVNFQGEIDFVYVWRRALAISEIEALHVDPFQIFWRREELSRLSDEMRATILSNIALSGSLTTAIQMAASVASNVAVSGSLTTQILMQSTILTDVAIPGTPPDLFAAKKVTRPVDCGHPMFTKCGSWLTDEDE